MQKIIYYCKSIHSRVVIKSLIYFFSIFLTSYANQTEAAFGESCVVLPPPFGSDVAYLENDTAYGYIKNNIDIKNNILDGCSRDLGDELKFCIFAGENSGKICDFASLIIGQSVLLGSISNNPYLGAHYLLKDVVLKAEQIEDKLCLVMPTSRGQYPIICRQYEDPIIAEPIQVLPSCQSIAASCFQKPTKSQSLFNFSGLTVECLQVSLNKLFYEHSTCVSNDGSILMTTLSPFPIFQDKLKTIVRAALILYVMIYGLMLILNIEYAEKSQIIMFVFKLIIVGYFSVGIGPVYFEGYGVQSNNNGVTEFVLPLMLGLTNSFVETVFLSGGSRGLCVFDVSKYQSGYEFYKVWDAIDCRIGYYFGMQILYTILDMASEIASLPSNADEVFKDLLGFRFFTSMFGFFLAGNIVVVLCGIIFGIVFLSCVFSFISSYLICVITLYAMCYVSPIFVPMVLFERTKGYFDSWLKIVISCALQPAIIGGMLAMILTMYDYSMYGNCEFERKEFGSFTSFPLKIPELEPEKCISSSGYQLIHHYYKPDAWKTKILILFPVAAIADAAYDGVVFLISFVYLFAFTILFYFFMSFVSEFAADLTGGISLQSVTISPQGLVNGVVNAAKTLKAGYDKVVKMDQDAEKKASQDKKSEQDKGDKGGDSSGSNASERKK